MTALLLIVSILLFSFVAGLTIHLLFTYVFRILVGHTRNLIDDVIIKTLQTPLILTTVISGVYISLTFINASYLGLFADIASTAWVIIWGWTISRIIKIVADALHSKYHRSADSTVDELIPIAGNVIIIGIVLLSGLIILAIWNIDITPAMTSILASAGLLGLALGFAAKETIGNFFGGMAVLFDKPYQLGDYVIIDNVHRGEVIQIGMRSTKIRTRDNVLITVPNSLMTVNTVVNETGFEPELRIRVPLRVAYGANLEHVEQVLTEVALQHPLVIKDPPPRIRYRDFSHVGVELEVLGLINQPEDRGLVIHELIKSITQRFEKEQIIIPFPRYLVNLEEKSS
jgi:small-conductance mechanosensitive channel